MRREQRKGFDRDDTQQLGKVLFLACFGGDG